MYSRREFATLVLSGAAGIRLTSGDAVHAQAAGHSMVNGIRVGVQTYSFRQLPRPEAGDMVDGIIAAMAECGLSECELWSPQLLPAGVPREEQRRWCLETPLDHFRMIRRKFNNARMTIHALNHSFNDSFSDQDIDRGFEMARALGAEYITASSTLSSAKRVVPFAEKHKMIVAMHNHSDLKDPNEFATPASFAAAIKMSKYFKVNLDIGHFTAANFDSLAYLREHHAHVTNLHVKDRRRNQGDLTPWGEGDAPIRDVLQLIQKNKWPIAAYLEYEYKGTGTPAEEVKKGYEFMRRALA